MTLGGLAIAGAAFTALASSVSCASNAEVDIGLSDPDNLKALAQYAQLAIFQGTCPSDQALAFGNLAGAIKFQNIDANLAFSDVGPLKKGKYGFAALLRRADCAVVGFGCTPVDLDVHRHVTIQFAPVSPPSGACDTGAGQTCDDGICTGGSPSEAGPGDTGAPDAEGGAKPLCTLDLVPNGGAELPAPALGNASVLGPSAVGTPAGFLSVYREGNADAANAVRVPVGDDGVIKTAVKDALTVCPADPSSNGITAGWNSIAKQGLMALGIPECPDAGPTSALFTSFDQDGKKLASEEPPLVVYELKFQSVNGVAGTPNDSTFNLAALERDPVFHPRFFAVTNVTAGENPNFPKVTTAATFVRIAAASGINAIAYDLPAGGGVNLEVAPPNSTYKPGTYAAGTTAAVGAWADLAMLAVASPQGIQWVVVKALGTKINEGTLNVPAATAVDVVALNDHFIVVAAGPQSLRLFRFDIDGDTITAPTQPIVLPPQVGGAKLDRFDGTMMSATGARNRVFITWLNKAGALGEGASPGGYAVFQCDG